MTQPIDISVVIVSHGHEAMLPDCVASVEAALRRLTSEIIVLDNVAPFAAAAALRGTRVRLLRNTTPQGFARNVNYAATLACGRYLLLLNPDTKHAAGALADAVAFMDGHPAVGVAGCTLLNPDGSVQQSYRRFPSLAFLLARGFAADRWPWQPGFYRRGLMAGERPAHPHPVDWVFGAFMLIRRADFERIGGMDESFRLYYEDVDLCRRFRGAGLSTYILPGVRFLHDHVRSSAAAPLSAAWRWHVLSAVHYFWKFRPSLSRRAAG